MKVSREQVALNRERIVETAARLFRQKGYDGIGVADLMKSAGLTHGGFYGHFASKEDLLAAATAHAFKTSVERWRGKAAPAPATAMASIGESYLSERHRDQPKLGCSITSLGADIARLGPKVRQALTEGARGQIAVLEELVPRIVGRHGPLGDEVFFRFLDRLFQRLDDARIDPLATARHVAMP